MTIITPSEFKAQAQIIKQEIQKVMVGQTSVIDMALTALFANGHLLLEGLPGLGKTMLVRTLASALQLDFSRVQFTPDLMPGDIIGTEILESDNQSRYFRFHQGPVFTNLLLADEINRATPKTQSALLEAMQERQVSAGSETYPLPQPFLVLATQNPIELEGTYPLPEAQLDRFLFKLNVSSPSAAELVEIMTRTTTNDVVQASVVADAQSVLAMQQLAREVPVATPVYRYIAELVANTHPDNPKAPDLVKRAVRFGASPRGAQALVMGAKVTALLDGRFNAAIADVQKLAGAALRHRMILTYTAEAEAITPDDIITAALNATPVT